MLRAREKLSSRFGLLAYILMMDFAGKLSQECLIALQLNSMVIRFTAVRLVFLMYFICYELVFVIKRANMT